MQHKLKTFEFMCNVPDIRPYLVVRLGFLKLNASIDFNAIHFLSVTVNEVLNSNLEDINEMMDIPPPGDIINPKSSRRYLDKTRTFFSLCGVMSQLNFIIGNNSRTMYFYMRALRSGYDKRDLRIIKRDRKARERHEAKIKNI